MKNRTRFNLELIHIHTNMEWNIARRARVSPRVVLIQPYKSFTLVAAIFVVAGQADGLERV